MSKSNDFAYLTKYLKSVYKQFFKTLS